MISSDALRGDEFWRRHLGLLPIPLFRDGDERPPFVVLNGARGNFCVDFGTYDLSNTTRAFSWSANVGHYVSIVGDKVEVQRWDQRLSAIERYTYASVASDFERFHAYLESNPPKHDVSVIAHAIRVFRSLRATLGPEVTGGDALRAFLYLLATSTEQVARGGLNLGHWRLSSRAEQTAALITNLRWDALHEELIRGRPHENLAPDLQLVLRHTSGQLFQEAHYEAMFFDQSQLLLDGFVPHPVTPGPNTTSIGLHFTPPALARTVVEEALVRCPPVGARLVIFDPACGSGEFLREALRQLKVSGFTGQVLLIGWDISEPACEMANFVLAWEARDAGGIEISIRCTDSLDPATGWPEDVDWVLMNPPFVAWQDMTVEQREHVRTILGDLHYQRADLSHAFLWKACHSVREGGVLGAIAPASLLDSTSATRLRSAMGELLDTRVLARLGNHALFVSATVDAALYIGQRADTRAATVAFWADHRVSSNTAGLRALRRIRGTAAPTDYPVLGSGYSIYLDPELGKGDGPWAPRPYKSWRIGQNLAGFPRVKDLFDVRQGIRTGHNPTFLLSRSALFSLPDAERTYFRPAVVNKSIKFGFLSDVEYVFYPYAERRLQSEEEVRTRLPVYYERYLKAAKPTLLARPRVDVQRWWELSEHRAWQLRPEAKLVSTYFGTSGSFAWDETGVYAVVQGFAWIPRRVERFDTQIGLAFLATLNSRLFETLLAGASNHVAGGQWNLSKKFVEQIAIPNYFREDVGQSLLQELSSVGARMHAGLPVDEERLGRLMGELYGADRIA